MSTVLAQSPSLAFRPTPLRKFWFDEDAEPPRSLAQERLHRQQRLAGAFRLFARYGFAQGLARNRPCVQADAADHLIAVNDGDALAELGRSDCAFLTGGAAADDDQIIMM